MSIGHPREQLTVQEPTQEPTQDSAAADEAFYPSGIRLWLAVASCCIVSFLHGLDLTIVAATVPSLTNHFKTVADIGWYSSAYSLMTASFSFLIGKLFGWCDYSLLYSHMLTPNVVGLSLQQNGLRNMLT